MPMPPGQRFPPYWSTYFAVEDADAALRTIEGAGGRTMMAPFDVPAGRFAVAQDPQGAAFALFQGVLDP